MTLVTGTVQDLGYDGMDGTLWARPARFRSDGSVVYAPERKPFKITDGVVSAELAPGPAVLELQVGSHARGTFEVVIPEEDTTLADLLDTVFAWEPAQVSLFVAEREAAELAKTEAEAAAGQAATAAGTATTAAQQTGQDRSHVDQVRTELDEAFDESTAGNVLPPRLTETALNATYGTDLGRRPVGKDEQIHDVRDHGADPTGATSSVAAINTLLATGVGHVLIAGGTYLVDAPILMTRSAQRLTVDESALIRVPSGYTGDVFRFDGAGTSIRGAVVDGGGTVAEEGKTGGAAVEPGTWTAVHFRAQAGTGTTACRVEGVQFNWCGTLCRYTTVGTGWVNGNTVDKVRALYFRVMVETLKGGPSAVGFASNTIKNIMAQAGNFTTHGVKELSGRGWTFQDVSPWDMPAGSVGLDVNSDARSIQVIGGIMSARGVVSRAPAGEVEVNDFHTPKPWIAPAQTLPANIFAPDPTSPLVATITAHKGWPVALLGAGAATEASAYYRVPPLVNSIQIQVLAIGTEAISGEVRLSLRSQIAVDGSVATRSFALTMDPDAIVESAWSDPLVVVPGSLLRLIIRRTHNASADDTLAGTVGVAGYAIRPAGVRS